MAKLIKVFDPSETQRRIGLVIQRDSCPGFLEFLAELPYGAETPLLRGILYQWYLAHQEAGDLDAAIEAAMNGPGGFIQSSGPSPRRSAAPARRNRSTAPKTVRAPRQIRVGQDNPAAQEAPATPSAPAVSAAPEATNTLVAAPVPVGAAPASAPTGHPIVAIVPPVVPPAQVTAPPPAAPATAPATGHPDRIEPVTAGEIDEESLATLAALENML